MDEKETFKVGDKVYCVSPYLRLPFSGWEVGTVIEVAERLGGYVVYKVKYHNQTQLDVSNIGLFEIGGITKSKDKAIRAIDEYYDKQANELIKSKRKRLKNFELNCKKFENIKLTN